MTTETRRKPAVGRQIRRWRAERGLTLANVAERSGLNVGYLSQIENDKASPSLAVPRVDRRRPRRPDRLVPDGRRAAAASSSGPRSGRSPRRSSAGSSTSTGATSRDVSILEVTGGDRAGGSAPTPMPATSITSSCAAGCG